MSKDFWIVNISKMNVSLSDLRLTVPAGRVLNLLDSRHFCYTLEQLEQSAKSGSLFKKSDKIRRRGAPEKKPPLRTIEIANDYRPTRKRTLVQVEEFSFEDLPGLHDEQNVSDQKFAEEFADDSDFK